MRVIYGEDGEIARKNCRVQDSPYVSGAVRAALEKSSVAVTALRFYWLARSREGVGVWNGMAWWSVTTWEMPLPGMHAAGPNGGPGAAAPGAFWGLFCGEKSPAGGRQGSVATRAGKA